MSLKTFTDGVRERVVEMQARGFTVQSFICCPEGQDVLLKAMMRETVSDATPVPLTLFSRPVRVDQRMPLGHIWYCLKGGKQ